MFRFASKAPLVAATCLRFQGSAPETASGAPGMRRRNNSRRAFRTTWNLPRFEIHDVRDDPALGTMTRIAIDGKQMLISQHPQLGPRKLDPNDVTPQFDRDRRISVRLRHMDLAALVAVVEGRIVTHHMKNNAYDLTFEKTAEGYTLKGQIRRATSTTEEEWAIQFDNQFATTIGHFLDSALTESFGFAKFHAAQHRLAEDRDKDRNYSSSNDNNRRSPRQAIE